MVSRHDGNKNLEYIPIIWFWGQKTLYFWPKNQFFFLRYAHITHFFGLKQTRLNGIISSPYPQVTLDTFGFTVDVRSAAQQAVLWPRLPKNGPFGAENAVSRKTPIPMYCLFFNTFFPTLGNSL